MNPDPTSLDRLHDIMPPPATPWWPPAPGWIVLASLLGFLLMVQLVGAIHAWQKNRYRRDALRELRILRKVATDSPSCKSVPTAIATVMKRVALTVWPREQVASLTGGDWWRLLDQSCEAGGFAKEVGPMLDRSVYDDEFARSLTPDQLDHLFGAAEYWIEHHECHLAQC